MKPFDGTIDFILFLPLEVIWDYFVCGVLLTVWGSLPDLGFLIYYGGLCTAWLAYVPEDFLGGFLTLDLGRGDVSSFWVGLGSLDFSTTT